MWLPGARRKAAHVARKARTSAAGPECAPWLSYLQSWRRWIDAVSSALTGVRSMADASSAVDPRVAQLIARSAQAPGDPSEDHPILRRGSFTQSSLRA
ncbi:hypothetical protein MTO96_011635 [Rhipicephalus appendiculatus]